MGRRKIEFVRCRNVVAGNEDVSVTKDQRMDKRRARDRVYNGVSVSAVIPGY